MSDDLRAAAERLLADITKTRGEVGIEYRLAHERARVGLKEPYELALAYLAEHPADDGEQPQWHDAPSGLASWSCWRGWTMTVVAVDAAFRMFVTRGKDADIDVYDDIYGTVDAAKSAAEAWVCETKEQA